MDWTAIYQEDGDEELVHFEEYLSHPRLSRLVSSLYLHLQTSIAAFDTEPSSPARSVDELVSETYTLSSLYYLTINYILGVGCLGIPYAFYKSGILLGTVLVVTVTVLSFMTVMWVAETGVRYQLIKRHDDRLSIPCVGNGSGWKEEKEEFMNEEDPDVTLHMSNMSKNDNNGHPMKTKPIKKNNIPSSENSLLLPPSQPSITKQNSTHKTPQEYEVINLISFFLGKAHCQLYQTSLMALMYIGLLAYSQVFVGSLSSIFCLSNDYISTILFATFVIPLSCTELDEQFAVQFLLAIVRFVAIFGMILGSCMGIFWGVPEELQAERSDHEWVDFSGFGVAFSTALFSQLFQHSVPGLVRPLGKTKKKNVSRVFAYALMTTCAFYLLLGITASLCFGTNTNPSVNLNFAKLYQGNVLGRLISKLIVFFPALDTLSVFPLIANTLGNNLLAVCHPSKLIHSLEHNHLFQKISQTLSLPTRKTSQKTVTVTFRLIASIPPLCLSLFLKDLSTSMQLAGMAGIYVAFFAPALLQISSDRMMKSRFGVTPKDLSCSGWYSGVGFTLPVLVFAGFALILALGNFVVGM